MSVTEMFLLYIAGSLMALLRYWSFVREDRGSIREAQIGIMILVMVFSWIAFVLMFVDDMVTFLDRVLMSLTEEITFGKKKEIEE